jgi:deoxycytidine triphosphate deaminase
LKTRFKFVDPQSVEHVSSASELWKPVRKYTSKNNGSAYFHIAPGATILTHTKERIRIPDDCAGKIEIKSTFARLSLSITFGDFCNPGYDGYFPLEIKNNGRHTIIIHENETMAQLMLIPLQGPILDEYSSKATFKNNKGYDDGTPYSFWRERSIKTLRQKRGTQQIIELSQELLGKIKAGNTEDVNAFKERFNNNFLPFCHKNINKAKHRNHDNNLPDTRKLINAYIKREKRLKTLFGIKWLSGIVTVISGVLPVILQLWQNAKAPNDPVTITSFWPSFVVAGAFLIATIVLVVLCPKTFCTFENIDIDEQLSEMTTI